jgi:hypothetical protein
VSLCVFRAPLDLDIEIFLDGEGVSLIDILNDDGYYSKTDQLLIDSDIKIKINQIIIRFH